MLTIRNVGGVSLLLMGSTWLWLTPAFASRGVPNSGVMWGVTNVLSLLTVAGFCMATWGLFARHGWWEWVALASGALGLLALVIYWIAAARAGEAAGTAGWNFAVHVIMLAGLAILLLVPQMERWVDHRVMSG